MKGDLPLHDRSVSVSGGCIFAPRAYLRLSPFDTSKDQETAQFINERTNAEDYVMICDVDDRSRWGAMNLQLGYTRIRDIQNDYFILQRP